MKIYEIDEEIRMLLNDSVDNDGVIDEEKMIEAQGLFVERDKKILNFAKFLKEKEAEIDSLKDAEKRIADRRKSLEGFHSRNSEFLVGLVDKKLSDAEITVNKRRSERLIIDGGSFFTLNDLNCADDYICTQITTSIDKNKIKAEIKAGAEFNGAHIEEHYSLQIK